MRLTTMIMHVVPIWGLLMLQCMKILVRKKKTCWKMLRNEILFLGRLQLVWIWVNVAATMESTRQGKLRPPIRRMYVKIQRKFMRHSKGKWVSVFTPLTSGQNFPPRLPRWHRTYAIEHRLENVFPFRSIFQLAHIL